MQSKIEKLPSYFSLNLVHWEAYHNHKENMANAGFLVQLSLFGSIISGGLWPPEWVVKVTRLPEIATFAIYLILWFLIHYYTRWQLINKRVAALYYAGISQAFLYFVNNELTADDLELNSDATHVRSLFKDFISKVVYIPGGFCRMDASVKKMPEFIAREIKSKFLAGSGAETLEILITYTSFLLMLIVGIKIFMS